MRQDVDEITIAKDADPARSSKFAFPWWAIFLGFLIPNMDAGAISMEASTDGSTFHPILDPTDGEDLVVVASGSDPGWIDVSDYVRFLPRDTYLRLVSATVQTTAAVTITYCLRG